MPFPSLAGYLDNRRCFAAPIGLRFGMAERRR